MRIEITEFQIREQRILKSGVSADVATQLHAELSIKGYDVEVTQLNAHEPVNAEILYEVDAKRQVAVVSEEVLHALLAECSLKKPKRKKR